MRLTAHVACGIAALSFLTGCIEFEEQTILIHADPAKDVVRFRLVYQGIYSGESLKDDLPHLRKVADRGTIFYLLDSWPFEVDVGKPEEGETANPGSVVLRRFGTKVTNGTFYLDEAGRLCAWQDVEFPQASKALRSLGMLVNLAVMTGKADVLDDADAETKAMWRDAALSGHEWFKIDPAGVHFEFPVSDADAAKMKRGFLESILEEALAGARDGDGAGTAKEGEESGEGKEAEEGGDVAGELTELEAILRTISRNKLSWVHRGNRVTVTLAADESGVATAHAWNEGRYVPNLLEPASEGGKPPELPAPVDREMTTRKLVESFPPR